MVQGLIDPNGTTGTQSNPAAIPEPDNAVGTVTDQLDRVTKYDTNYLGAVLKLCAHSEYTSGWPRFGVDWRPRRASPASVPGEDRFPSPGAA